MAYSHLIDFSGLTANLTTLFMNTFGSKAVRLYTTMLSLSKVFFFFSVYFRFEIGEKERRW